MKIIFSFISKKLKKIDIINGSTKKKRTDFISKIFIYSWKGVLIERGNFRYDIKLMNDNNFLLNNNIYFKPIFFLYFYLTKYLNKIIFF